MNLEELIEGAARVHRMNEVLKECSVQELRYLLKVIPFIISDKEREESISDQTDHK